MNTAIQSIVKNAVYCEEFRKLIDKKKSLEHRFDKAEVEQIDYYAYELKAVYMQIDAYLKTIKNGG